MTMDAMMAIATRRSVRRFQDKPVPRELLQELIEAAAMAPSACNRQDWECAVVMAHDRKMVMAECVARKWKELLAACDSDAVRDAVAPYAGNFDWFATAPVVLAVSSRAPEEFLVALAGSELAAADIAGTRVSAAMAVQNLMLAAHAKGLGSCCLTGPVAAADELRPLLGLGRRRELVCLVALGYPAEQPSAPSRKPVAQAMRFVDDSGDASQ